MAAWSVLWKAGVKPQRFMETRASRRELGGLPAVAGHEAALGLSRVTWRRSSTPRSMPSSPTRQMPRVTGEEPMTASASR